MLVFAALAASAAFALAYWMYAAARHRTHAYPQLGLYPPRRRRRRRLHPRTPLRAARWSGPLPCAARAASLERGPAMLHELDLRVLVFCKPRLGAASRSAVRRAHGRRHCRQLCDRRHRLPARAVIVDRAVVVSGCVRQRRTGGRADGAAGPACAGVDGAASAQAFGGGARTAARRAGRAERMAEAIARRARQPGRAQQARPAPQRRSGSPRRTRCACCTRRGLSRSTRAAQRVGAFRIAAFACSSSCSAAPP